MVVIFLINMKNFIRFLFFVSAVWGIMFLAQMIVYASLAKAFNFSWPYWGLTLGMLSTSYLIGSVIVRKFHNKFSSFLYFVVATWLGVFLIIFSVILPYELLSLIFGFISTQTLTVLLIIALLVSTYAIFNGRRLTVKEYTLPIKNLANPVKAVHLTDIHIGTVHQTKFLERVVSKTNELKPEVIYMTGDLFDGAVPIDETILAPLNDLEAPIFFSNGNHEEYEGLQYVRETITHVKPEMLENKMIMHDGIQVIGVNDRQSHKKGENLRSILDSLSLNKDLPTVLMYHTPVDWQVAREHGVDVMLSGHTHNGQIFPFNLLVKFAFKYMTGLYQEEGKFLHVSPGTGTWGPPMRLGSRNEITVLHLIPE